MLRVLAPAAVRCCLNNSSVERWTLAFAFMAIGLGFYIISKAEGQSQRPGPEAPAAPINNGSFWRLWPPVVIALLLLGGCTAPYGPGGFSNFPNPRTYYYYGQPPFPSPRQAVVYSRPVYRSYGTMPIDALGPYTPIIPDLPPPRIERAPEPEPEPEPVIAKPPEPRPEPKPQPVVAANPPPARELEPKPKEPATVIIRKPPGFEPLAPLVPRDDAPINEPVTPPSVERPCYRWFDPCHFYGGKKS